MYTKVGARGAVRLAAGAAAGLEATHGGGAGA